MLKEFATIVHLKSSDGVVFEVPAEVAVLSKLLRSIILPDKNDEDDGSKNEEFNNGKELSNTNTYDLNLPGGTLVIRDGNENEEDNDNSRELINAYTYDLNLPGGTIFIRNVAIRNVTSQILAKVIEFCEHHVQTEDKMPEIGCPLEGDTLESNVSQWYVDFINVDFDMLQDLVTVANYLDIPRLLDLSCLALTFQIKGLSQREMADKFGVDFAEVEAAEVELKAALNRD